MNVTIEQAVDEAREILFEGARSNGYGDISVTITMHEGVPVKLTHSVCEHLSKRKTKSLVVNK